MVQEEKCTETFVKDCFIESEKSAVKVVVVVCRKPLVRDCEGDSGEVVCSTQYETECSNRHTVTQVSTNHAHAGLHLFMFLFLSSYFTFTYILISTYR